MKTPRRAISQYAIESASVPTGALESDLINSANSPWPDRVICPNGQRGWVYVRRVGAGSEPLVFGRSWLERWDVYEVQRVLCGRLGTDPRGRETLV